MTNRHITLVSSAFFALVATATLLFESSVEAFLGGPYVMPNHKVFHEHPINVYGTSSSRISHDHRHGGLYMTVTTDELIEQAAASGGKNKKKQSRMASGTNFNPGRTKHNERSFVTRRSRRLDDVNIVRNFKDDGDEYNDDLYISHGDATSGSPSIPQISLNKAINNNNTNKKKQNKAGGTVNDNDSNDLKAMGINIPFGLRHHLLTNAYESFHKRIWIIDNSGSMNFMDGHQVLVEHGQQHAATTNECTRWLEAKETVECHAQLSAALGVPTDFHLLNPPKVANSGPLSLLRGQQTFRVGYGVNRNTHHVRKDCRHAQNVMVRTEPDGNTPLAQSITDIRREIVQLQPQLEAEGRKVCLVIATDGSNYNPGNVDRNHNSNDKPLLLENIHHIAEEERQKDVIAALSSLQGLPVVVVIRLCTDHQPLVDFYSTCFDRAAQSWVSNDGREEDNPEQHLLLCHDLLEVDIDVLDDHAAEAREVHRYNPWLNYALILHRMREMGQEDRIFDMLDERPLDRTEIYDFICRILFGTTLDHRLNVYDDVEWSRFAQQVDQWQRKEHKQWNPLTKAMAPWIDTDALLAMQ